jgi:hypothetical protein
MMDFKTQLKVSLPSLIFGGSVGITVAYNDYGVWSLVWGNIIQTIAEIDIINIIKKNQLTDLKKSLFATFRSLAD